MNGFALNETNMKISAYCSKEEQGGREAGKVQSCSP